jgi:hypothetical protein
MYMRIGFALFSKRLVTSFITIIQLFVTIIIANVIIVDYNAYMEDICIMENFDTDRTYLWMPAMTDTNDELRWEQLKQLKHNRSVRAVEVTFRANAIYNNNIVSLIGYGQNTGELINMTLESGKWYTEVPKKDGVINCVSISSIPGLEIGKLIELEIIPHYSEQTINQTFQVVGTLGKRAKTLTFNQSSASPYYDYLFQVFHSTPLDKEYEDYDHQVGLIFDQSDLPTLVQSQYWDGNRLVYIDSIDDETFLSLKDELRKDSYVVKLEQAKRNTLQEIRETMMEFLPIVIPLFLIGFLGVVCISILNTLKYMRTFAIFFICGMRWKDSILICLSYIAYIILGVLILCIPGYVWLKDLLETGGIMAANNYLFTLGALLAVMLLSLVTPFLLIRKEEPIMVLRKVG